MIVNVTVKLNINVDTEEEVNNVLQEMDYNFSYVEIEEGIGKTLNEVNKIISTEIINTEIL